MSTEIDQALQAEDPLSDDMRERLVMASSILRYEFDFLPGIQVSQTLMLGSDSPALLKLPGVEGISDIQVAWDKLSRELDLRIITNGTRMESTIVALFELVMTVFKTWSSQLGKVWSHQARGPLSYMHSAVWSACRSLVTFADFVNWGAGTVVKHVLHLVRMQQDAASGGYKARFREMWLYDLAVKAKTIEQDFLKKCGGAGSESCREAQRILRSTEGTRDDVKKQLDTLFELQKTQANDGTKGNEKTGATDATDPANKAGRLGLLSTLLRRLGRVKVGPIPDQLTQPAQAA